MPKIYGHKVGVFKEELIPLVAPSYDALQKKLKRYEDKQYGMKRLPNGYGGNGRNLLVDYDTLEDHYKAVIPDPRESEHPLLPFFTEATSYANYFFDFIRPNSGQLKKKEAEKYILQANVLNALTHLEEARTIERLTKGGSLRKTKKVPSLIESLHNDVITFNNYLLDNGYTEHKLPGNIRKFTVKFELFKSEGPYSLIRDPEGKTVKNAEKNNILTKGLLNSLFIDETKPTATQVFVRYNAFLDGYIEVINKNTGEAYNPKEFKKLSASSVKKWLASYESKVGTHHIRKNDRQKNINNFIPHFSFEETKYAGSLLSVDDRQPPFYYNKNRDRVWFYNAIDVASGAYVATVYGKTKKGLILEFYRQIVRNYHQWGLNLPHGLEAESSLNSSFTSTFLKNGAMFGNVRIESNNARGKVIERYFRDMRYGLEKEDLGWVARPFAKSEANSGDPTAPIQVVEYDTIVQNSLQNMTKHNNMPHKRVADMSRWEYFLNNQHPDLLPTNYKLFLRDLGYHTESSVNKGIVRFRNREFILGSKNKIDTGDRLIALLKQIEGREIDIYWLDANDGSVLKALVTIKGDETFVCELIQKPKGSKSKLEETPETALAFRQFSAYVRTVTEFIKTQKRAIDPVAIIGEVPKTISDSFVMPGLKPRIDFDTENEAGEVITEEQTKPEEVGLSWDQKFKV
ncbi:MAG: hypothetical protein R3279_08335 [Putridiphycobacter sp.]|nr:hypothetical protein [Putridiphycobacter sp.]